MPHVLIVDDDPSTREALAAIIGEDGLTTATAGDLREARIQLVRQTPDVVFTDLKLPDGSGVDLFEDLSEVSFGGSHGVFECRDEGVGAGPLGARLGGAATELLLVETDHLVRDRREQRQLLIEGLGAGHPAPSWPLSVHPGQEKVERGGQDRPLARVPLRSGSLPSDENSRGRRVAPSSAKPL